MAANHRIRAQQILRQAEGYLELKMPKQALDTLARLTQPGTFRGHQRWLQGESLRSLEQYQAAISPLQEAADLLPSNIHVCLALGWCYKRTGRLDDAISALQRALDLEPREAILHYNLACYYSLASEKRRCLEHLSRAIKLDSKYRFEASEEHDFDPMRADPDFQAITTIIV
jgi:Flp pilus assembly protein TadD